MHKIAEKEFTLEDFSYEHLKTDRDFMMYAPTGYRYSAKDLLTLVIETLNHYRKEYLETKDKEIWWQLIQLLPSSYNQTRNVMLNYEVLANIYRQRKNHKLDEWREFCKWIESLPYSELIIGDVILQMKIQQSNSVNLNRTKYPPYTAEEFLEAIEEAHRAFYAKRDNDESC